MDHLDVPDTGRIALKTLAADEGAPSTNAVVPATKQDVAVIARQVDELLSKAQEAQGAHKIWRALGGAGFTLALALGGVALNLAKDASRDHDRLDRLEAEVSATEATVGELQRITAAQSTTLAASAARIDAQLDRIDDLLNRVDRRLDTFDQRLTAIERRH